MTVTSLITKSIVLMLNLVYFLCSTVPNVLYKYILCRLYTYAFALSPIPSYLPQFISLFQYQTKMTGQKQQRRQRYQRQQKEKTSEIFHEDDDLPANDAKMEQQEDTYYDGELQREEKTTPSKIYPKKEHHNTSNKEHDDIGGMSLYSIYLLLVSHILRLYHFYNLQSEGDAIPHDLVLQSIIMVLLQSALCYITTSIEMKQQQQQQALSSFKAAKAKTSTTTTTLHLLRTNYELFLLCCFFLFVCFHFQLFSFFYLSSDTTGATIMPVDISSTSDNSQQWLLQLSILLESNLALPQCLRNYNNSHTKNLSVTMVCNRMIGDLLKMAYFLFISEEQNNPLLFVCGSFYSFVMDFIVLLQCVHWYPTIETVEWKDWIGKQQQQWKSKKWNNICLPQQQQSRKTTTTSVQVPTSSSSCSSKKKKKQSGLLSNYIFLRSVAFEKEG